MKKSLVALLMALVMMMTCVSALAVEGPEQDMSIFPQRLCSFILLVSNEA